MKQVGHKTSITTTAIAGGGKGVSKAGGGAKKIENKTPSPQAKPVVSIPAVTNTGGVQTTTKPDGSVSKKADSGMKLESSGSGTKSLSIPGENGGNFTIGKDGEVNVTGGDAKGAAMVKDDQGVDLLNYTDKKGHQVWVDSETMSYSVVKSSSVDPNNITAQVFEPDGSQVVIVEGTRRSPEGKHESYSNVATFGKDGGLVSNEGFSNLKTKNGKLEFDLGGGKATRELPRALPGQSQEAKETPKPAAQQSAAPTALLAEQPLLLTGPDQPLLLEGPKKEVKTDAPAAVETPAIKNTPAAKETPAADPAKAAAKAAKAERKERLDNLRNVSKDFFVPEKNPDAQFGRTKSGVIVRNDDESMSFSLPTGDKFRTDGDVVAVLGDNPRIKSAQLTDDQQFLVFKDKNRNSFQLDTQSGDLKVSNADGTIKQKLMSDGSESISAISVHTTETGEVVRSEHTAQFDPEGKLVSKSGFDDLKTGSKHLEYTLPNGNPTVRNLLMETKGKSEPPKEAKSAPSFDPDTQAMVDSILGKTSAPEPATSSNPTGAAKTAGPINPDPFNQPPTSVSGVTRKTLPDGSVQTSLPSGITFNDGEKPTATAADGTKLEVLKREVPSEGGYILYAKGKDGVGYTIAPEHIDYIAEGKDGKVHQLLKENGEIMTSITDGQRQHVHQFDSKTMQHQGSPGVFVDQRTPGHIYVADQPNRTYELPVGYPTPPTPPGQQPPDYGAPNPNMPQPGVKLSFMDKVKGWFGAGPAARNNGAPPPPGHNMPHQCSGMPSSHHHYDPVADQMKSMRTMNNVMMGVNIASVGLTMLGTMAMPGMLFPYGGMYGW